MEFILVEVTPSEDSGGYHASLNGNTAMCGENESIEGAIQECIITHPHVFKLTAEDIAAAKWDNNKRMLGLIGMKNSTRNLVKFLSERGYVLEIKFFPCEFR